MHDSPERLQRVGIACPSGSSYDDVTGELKYAEAYLDSASAPAVGEIVYLRIEWDTLIEDCTTGAALEVIPPPGAVIAVDASNPMFCGFSGQSALLCATAQAPGDHGGTYVFDARSGSPRLWDVPDYLNSFRIHVPIRMTRAFGVPPAK